MTGEYRDTTTTIGHIDPDVEPDARVVVTFKLSPEPRFFAIGGHLFGGITKWESVLSYEEAVEVCSLLTAIAQKRVDALVDRETVIIERAP